VQSITVTNASGAGLPDWAKFRNFGYFLKPQANFVGEIWFVVGILRVPKGYDVDFQIQLDEYILALFGLATVLAYIFKICGIFSNLLVTLIRGYIHSATTFSIHDTWHN
jgi:hypothetical protein